MKKKLLIIFIILGVIRAILWSFDILRFYKNQTIANEPNLKVGAKVVWSTLAKPERLDFICFNAKDNYLGEYTSVMRLVGLPYDILEIRDGDLYVNNIFIDKAIDLRRLYKYDKAYSREQIEPPIEGDYDRYHVILGESIGVYLDESDSKSSKIRLERLIQPRNQPDKSVQGIYNRDWNADHFGPLRIPEDKYFVMGDNRENSLDSRYIGLINKNDILGTIIYTTN